MSGRLGELLVRENLISVQHLRKAQEEQQKTGRRIGTALIKVGAIEESKLTDFLSKQYGVPAINLKEFDVEPDIIKLVPKDVAEKHLVVPVNRAGSALIVAMCDPSNIYAVDDLKFLTGYNIEAVVASEPAIREAIERYYAEKGPSLEDIVNDIDGDDVEVAEGEGDVNVEEAAKAADDAPVIKLVNLILKDAITKRASDIHIEPGHGRVRVRFRVDGMLRDTAEHPLHLHSALISRLKIMASMDIAEKRKPQDGRIGLKLEGREVDVRCSILPSSHGESIVMRLLDRSRSLIGLRELGFEDEDYRWFRRLIQRPNGLVLVTGPTGSGKTTTLYAALSELNHPRKKIITIEDPVEYELTGINQIPVNPKRGLTFAGGLRSILRQDPDVILVGEIRDAETVDIAIRSALTGHLILRTLHTNDALSSVGRLVDMGAESFLVASVLEGLLAQRLGRRICRKCAHKVPMTDDQRVRIAPAEVERFGGQVTVAVSLLLQYICAM